MVSDLPRQELYRALPFARRFARALTRGQQSGDKLVTEALKRFPILPDEETSLSARHRLYRIVAETFRQIVKIAPDDVPGLSLDQRFLLLLTALEEVPIGKAAEIIGLDERTAMHKVMEAHKGLRSMAETSVLIIEDEPIIAFDIQNIVEQSGHRCVGVAHTEADAVRLARETQPGLILADINLGAGGDGMSAVRRIGQNQDIPVIFVTAYPERLLTGESEEPPFVITKPFEPMTLAITTYQAVTGGLSTI